MAPGGPDQLKKRGRCVLSGTGAEEAGRERRRAKHGRSLAGLLSAFPVCGLRHPWGWQADGGPALWPGAAARTAVVSDLPRPLLGAHRPAALGGPAAGGDGRRWPGPSRRGVGETPDAPTGGGAPRAGGPVCRVSRHARPPRACRGGGLLPRRPARSTSRSRGPVSARKKHTAPLRPRPPPSRAPSGIPGPWLRSPAWGSQPRAGQADGGHRGAAGARLHAPPRRRPAESPPECRRPRLSPRSPRRLGAGGGPAPPGHARTPAGSLPGGPARAAVRDRPQEPGEGTGGAGGLPRGLWLGRGRAGRRGALPGEPGQHPRVDGTTHRHRPPPQRPQGAPELGLLQELGQP